MGALHDDDTHPTLSQCQASRPPALVVTDKIATLNRLIGACAAVLGQVEHVPFADHEGLHAAFSRLTAASPILIATRDRLLVMNKGDDAAGCPVCLTLGRMSHGTELQTAAFRRGVICDSAPPEMLTDMALSTAAVLIGMVASDRADDVAWQGFAQTKLPRPLPRKAFSIELTTADILPFTTMADASCAFCRTAEQDAPAFQLGVVTKSSPRSLRHSGLSDLAVPVDTLVNPVCGPLGPIVFHARAGAYCTSARGEFRQAAINRTSSIGWFGLVPRPGDCVVAGVLEGLERRAGLSHSCRTRMARFNELGPIAVDPRLLGVYDETIYAQDKALTPFAPDREIEWVEGWSIEQQSLRLLPREYCYYGKPGIINGNSSGCATGSAREEALLHGLLELIERDSFVLYWLAKLSPPRIKPHSVTDTASRAMIARIEEAGGELFLLDARLDLQIPIVIAAIVDRRGEYGGFSVASGASQIPEEAVRKALYEVAVHFEAFAERAAFMAGGPLGGALQDFSLVKTLDDHPTMFGLPGAIKLAEFLVSSPVERSFAETFAQWEASGPVRETVDQDLLRMLDILHAAGFPETIAIEQTTREQKRLGLSTMRAIVPGLLPIDFGHGKCRAATLPRLRDLPFQLGLRNAPLQGADINRVPHPYP